MKQRMLTAMLACTALMRGTANPTSPAADAPRLFADGVVSTSDDEFGGSFTPNGDTVYFTKSAPHSYRYTMFESHRIGTRWSAPTVLPFSGRYTDSDPTLSPDGKKMFWSSDRPVERGVAKHDYDIWMVERTSSGAWGTPTHLPAPINSDGNEYAASMTDGGTLYFSSTRSSGSSHAFRSRNENGAWGAAEDVTRLIDQGDSTVGSWDLDVMIDPRERFILLGSLRPNGVGNYDIYVAWNNAGNWTKAIHLPAAFNTRARDYAPHISPDGQTLYFSSERGFAQSPLDHRLDYRELTTLLRGTLNGSGNIYTMPMSALDALRPEACPAERAAEFSWWPGTWDYAIPGYDPAVSTVTSSDGGCAIQEEFVDRGGQKMHGTIRYDAASANWQRTVIDPFRTYKSTGVFASDGSVSFYETPTERETYRPASRDVVHFIGEKSEDDGKTWKVLFDATYTRRR